VTALGAAFTPRVKALHPDLAWEVGPGKTKSNMLAISAKSNWALRPETDKVVAAAPTIERWEFYPSIPPRDPPPVIELGQKLRIETAAWKFVPEYDQRQGKIHLTIVDDKLAALERERAFHAVLVFLDGALGEDTVETRIGNIEIEPSATGLDSLYAIHELCNYIDKKRV
jgi:hypothetical protein